LLNVVDGCMPSDLATGTSAEIEEKRRLLYVAMTRVRDATCDETPLDAYLPRRAFEEIPCHPVPLSPTGC